MTDPLSTLSIDEARLKNDEALMEKKAPEAQLTSFPSNEYPIGWRLIMSTETAEYHIKICYHAEYPTEPPHVFETSGAIDTVNTPHINQTGQLSLSSNQRDRWDKKSTVASFIYTIVAWLYCYEVYQKKGHWPGTESTSQSRIDKWIDFVEFYSPNT